MPFRVVASENPFTTTSSTVTSWFVRGIFVGVLLTFSFYNVVTWTGWKSLSSRPEATSVADQAPPGPASE